MVFMEDLMNNGFICVSLVSPKLEVAKPEYNVNEILRVLKDLKSDVAVFPELAITSYSCGDLFLFDEIRIASDKAIEKLINENPYKGLLFVGGILSYQSALFNVAFVIKEHELIGIVPKYYLPNYQEFGEPRWFTAGLIAKRLKTVHFLGKDVPFGMLIFRCSNAFYPLGISAEICEDVWAPISPSNLASLNGANVFINLSASNDYLYKDKKRENMVSEASRKNRGAYLYVSSNSSESSSGLVFGSSEIAAIYGEIILSDPSLSFETKIREISLDLGYIDNLRKKDSPYKESLDEFDRPFTVIDFTLEEDKNPIVVDSHPFVLKDDEYPSVHRILELQSYGLGRRLKFLNCQKVILGVSGGLDSTMSLLAAYHTALLLKIEPSSMIVPVFLPYINSSSRTKSNAERLTKALGLTPLIIPINKEVDEILAAIGNTEKDVTYENAQVRVRTTILMELANKYHGIMLGTSDLSEIAMGYSTFNGDSMSMYNVNSSITKTMMQSILRLYAKEIDNKALSDVLFDVIATPISAELNAGQLTEKEIGKYEYIDFILFRFLRRGDTKERIKMLMPMTFKINTDESNRIVDEFFDRFFKAQYKRNAAPDSLKVANGSLDPHFDFKMPSDVKR